jgi:hypothetical protein
VQLQFFAKSEILQFDEIRDFSAVVLYDFVGDGQRLQFRIDYR